MRPDEPDRREGRATGGLDGRVLTTLQGLRGRIAFSGLRRVLGAHPESLSRALRRLEREGLVERAEGGYRALSPPVAAAPPAGELRSIASVDLPPGVGADFVRGRLTGRWFGSLRWVGLVERADGPLLAWAGRDGSGYVLLGLQRGVLRVFVPVSESGSDPADGEESAYELLAHAVDALRFTSASSPSGLALISSAEESASSWIFEN